MNEPVKYIFDTLSQVPGTIYTYYPYIFINWAIDMAEVAIQDMFPVQESQWGNRAVVSLVKSSGDIGKISAWAGPPTPMSST